MTDKPAATVVVTAASPARHLASLIHGLNELGWATTVCATMSAEEAFAQDWNHSLPGMPGEGQPDVVLVAPATFHTVAAIAAGLNDTEPLQVIQRAIGTVPVYVWPHIDNQLAANPVLARNLRLLTSIGVQVVDTAVCEGGCPAGAHWPQVLERFNWHARAALAGADRDGRVEPS